MMACHVPARLCLIAVPVAPPSARAPGCPPPVSRNRCRRTGPAYPYTHLPFLNLWSLYGQTDHEAGLARLRVECDFPPVSNDDASYDVQPQAGSLANLLGGEER